MVPAIQIHGKSKSLCLSHRTKQPRFVTVFMPRGFVRFLEGTESTDTHPSFIKHNIHITAHDPSVFPLYAMLRIHTPNPSSRQPFAQSPQNA
jgi:hypothetical protein